MANKDLSIMTLPETADPDLPLRRALNGLAAECGVLVGGDDAFSDGAPIEVACATFRIAHDERGAPLAVDADGTEIAGLQVSITDEDDVRLLAWAQADDSRLLGMGIDLCSPADFARDPFRDRMAGLLFTPREREALPLLAAGHGAQGEALAHAALFASKEAAFKATAGPLRRWYALQGAELPYELRDFESGLAGTAWGTARSGRAAIACQALGIAEIALERAVWHGHALVIAVARGMP